MHFHKPGSLLIKCGTWFCAGQRTTYNEGKTNVLQWFESRSRLNYCLFLQAGAWRIPSIPQLNTSSCPSTLLGFFLFFFCHTVCSQPPLLLPTPYLPSSCHNVMGRDLSMPSVMKVTQLRSWRRGIFEGTSFWWSKCWLFICITLICHHLPSGRFFLGVLISTQYQHPLPPAPQHLINIWGLPVESMALLFPRKKNCLPWIIS